MWVNSSEIPGNGIDDDHNGYIDDVYGINAITGTGTVTDDHGHGTHVSGTIGAVGNNSTGIAGVNWNISILSCKFLNSSGSGYVSDAVECMQYIKAMKDRGVNIVATNNSWGGGDYSQSLYDAINNQRDILFIAAAGNSSYDHDKVPVLPAGYYLPNVLAVAAADHTDAKASFSDYGKLSVHVSAPGVDIISLRASGTDMYKDGKHYIPDGDSNARYYKASGTSMATPHVTGVAALLSAQQPGRSWVETKNLILSGGDDIPSLGTVTITGKRINAYGSLTCVDRPLFAPLKASAFPDPGTKGVLAALSINCGAANGPVTFTDSEGNSLTMRDDGVSPDLQANDGVFSAEWTPLHENELLIFSHPSGTTPLRLPLYEITTYALAEASTQAVYSQPVEVKGGLAPYAWTLVSGSLPPGLTLNGGSGLITGTPTSTGEYKFIVQVADAENSVLSRELLIEVVDFPVYEAWARTYAGIGADDAYGIAVDTNGYVYTTGRSSNGQNDDFLTLKYDPGGNLIWARRYDAGYSERAYAVAVDGSGNIYVTGYTYQSSTYTYKYLTIKYDSSGSILWARTYDSGRWAYSVAVDEAGNIYVTGAGNGSMKTVKYDSAGNVLWNVNYSKGSDCQGTGITYKSGFLYVTGFYTSGSNSHFITLKYDTSGTLKWASAFDGGNDEQAQDVAVDSSGNVFVTGYSHANSDYNYLTLKYDPDGTLLWSKIYNVSSSAYDYAYGIGVDSNDNIYVMGYSWHVLGSEIVTICYDQSGEVIWTKTRYWGFNNYTYGYALAIDANDNLYIAGSSFNKIDHDFFVMKYTQKLAILNPGILTATLGAVFHEELVPVGGSRPVAWSISAGSLPEGLTLDSGTGVISGTPVSKGTSQFTIQVTDPSFAAAFLAMTIDVFDPVYTLSIWNQSPNSWYCDAITVGEAGNYYAAGSSYNGSNRDLYIIKYGPGGDGIWQKTYDSGFEDEGRGIALAGDGSIIAVTQKRNGTAYDCQIFKYDSNGNLLLTWDHGEGNRYCNAVAVDPAGSIYVTGYSNTDGSAFLAKYDPSGNLIWTRNGGGNALAIDKSGRVTVTQTGGGQLLKYDAEGNVVASFGGPYNYGIAVDNEGNTFLVGYEWDSSEGCQVNCTYALTIKYDPAGNELWRRTYREYSSSLYGVATDSSGNVYVTGNSRNSNGDYLTIKYDPSGTLLWVETYDDRDDFGKAVAVDSASNVYVTGNARNHCTTIKYGQAFLNITSSVLPVGVKGTSYSSMLTADSGQPPYTWAVSASALPSGLSLNSATGAITGTPVTTGVFSFTAQASDSIYTVVKPLSITVNEPITDLTITSVSAPSSGMAGASITITDTTSNSGTSALGASTTSFYLSANTLYDGSDVLLGSRTVEGLSGGASSSGSTSVTIPAGTATGTYYIMAVADAGGAVSETSESNNTKSSYAVSIGPDLTVTAVSGPSTAAAGSTFTVTDTTTNSGAGAAGISTTSFYLSSNTTYGTGDVLIGSRTINSIGPGSSSSGSASATVPGGTALGTYYIIAVADSTGAMSETSETNNTKCSLQISITPAVAPSADFSASVTSGYAPLSVAFTDLSSSSPSSWSWNFGDSGTSTQQNPSHTYTSAGTYTLSLIATNAGGSSTKTKTGYITVLSCDLGLIQTQYDGALNGGFLRLRNGTSSESVVLNRNISITIAGGYDCSLSSVTGTTMIAGSLIIEKGTAIIDQLTIQ